MLLLLWLCGFVLVLCCCGDCGDCGWRLEVVAVAVAVVGVGFGVEIYSSNLFYIDFCR